MPFVLPFCIGQLSEYLANRKFSKLLPLRQKLLVVEPLTLTGMDPGV
jgi:hypothetical protein